MDRYGLSSVNQENKANYSSLTSKISKVQKFKTTTNLICLTRFQIQDEIVRLYERLPEPASFLAAEEAYNVGWPRRKFVALKINFQSKCSEFSELLILNFELTFTSARHHPA